MSKQVERTRFKRIGIDILGVLLILASGLVGWIPGPGGLPFFFAGLGLLASNHEWAERILNDIKVRGNSLADTIFKDKPTIVIAYDIIASILIILGAVVISTTTVNIFVYLGYILIILGISLFLGNKRRLKRLRAWMKSKIKK